MIWVIVAIVVSVILAAIRTAMIWEESGDE